MRAYSVHFFINGKPMLVPDEEVAVQYEDYDAEDSGRDETGVMHRIPVRYKVQSWSFAYSGLTEEEKRYTEELFPDAPDFTFRHPERKDATALTDSTAYRTKYSISWKNARTGLWKNYKFNIIEC